MMMMMMIVDNERIDLNAASGLKFEEECLIQLRCCVFFVHSFILIYVDININKLSLCA